jgi:glycosyltransferase involved in cell wall biosynthesis
MKVWIFQTGEPLQIDNLSSQKMRVINLSENLIKKGFKVKIISSSFFHQKKKHRVSKCATFKLNSNLQITLIKSPGYKKNISLSRLYDHFILAKNLNNYLKNINQLPDVAVIGFPPIETGYILAKWFSKKNIPYIVDIKDLWPEIFYLNCKNFFLKFIIKSLVFPYQYCTNYILKNASGISTISKSFLNYYLKKNHRKIRLFDSVCYLTKESTYSKNYNLNKKKLLINKSMLNIYFVGNLTSAFDFKTIIGAASLLQKNDDKCKFFIAGKGECHKELKEQIKLNKLNNIKLIGYVNKYQNSFFLQSCDFLIAPYINRYDFKMTISNKIIESLQYSLPIITPLKGEIKKILHNYKVGVPYKENDKLDLYKKIKKMCMQKKNRNNTLKKNCRRYAKSIFNHKKNYDNFSKLLILLKKKHIYSIDKLKGN